MAAMLYLFDKSFIPYIEFARCYMMESHRTPSHSDLFISKFVHDEMPVYKCQRYQTSIDLKDTCSTFP